ncbi:aminoglycoside phosphotransferase family protein [Streptomyces sp. NBC_01166]|uniref:phosphotransferase family protein n=1 Tax=Streptomyces sp. NBC_01166 TaxID=2903755 RepID=UPI00386F04E6|nr:aminoglycoside phosphotransferase family protein [Streptomyces sp. NBC_01166]
MRLLKHGYTNRTVGDGAVVEKSYEGPDAELRLRREHALLTRLQDRLPVPPVQGMTEARLTLGFVAGAHGQELLAAGQPEAVLASCGELLRNIHGTAPSVLPEDAPSAEKVLVHGDFGPNNVLLDPATFEVTAVVDWEFAHLGDPIEDLAWCEWIVRTHHSEHRRALGHFFRAYGGEVPPWPVRRAAMLTRCEELRQFCDRWEPNGPGVRLWQGRAAATADWQE